MIVYPMSDLKAKIIYKPTGDMPHIRIMGLGPKVLQVENPLSNDEWEKLSHITIYLDACGEWKPFYVRKFRPVFSSTGPKSPSKLQEKSQEKSQDEKTCLGEFILDEVQIKSFARCLSVARSFNSLSL